MLDFTGNSKTFNLSRAFSSLEQFYFLVTQYYLKAQFHFNKNQFADLMVISGIAGTISQVFLALIF